MSLPAGWEIADKIIRENSPESAVEKLAQAILENRVRVVQTSARSLAYEIRVTPTAAQLEEIRASQASETHAE